LAVSDAGPAAIAISADDADQRLDRWLRRRLPRVPLGALMKHLRTGAIRVDGNKADGALRLRAGMVVTLRLPAADLAAAPRAAAPALRHRGDVPIVFRDDDVLVVDKPAALASQPGTGQAGHTLVDWLLAQPFARGTATFRPAPVHRLDRGTSGLDAIGLSPRGLRALAAAFRDDRVHKVYLAVVHGVPVPKQGTIEAPLLVRSDVRTDQPKVVVDPRGQPARTDYEVTRAGAERALLRVVLHTGRQHQIRAHLAHLGHPIVGDCRYGSPVAMGDRFLLHANELTFPHPADGRTVRLVCAPPAMFEREFR
jgi:23S rRNA pseudouridine955/2504/2580 synthase